MWGSVRQRQAASGSVRQVKLDVPRLSCSSTSQTSLCCDLIMIWVIYALELR